MDIAIAEARESRRLGDYAIGAVIAHRGKLLVKTGNRIRTEVDATSHTEMVAIRLASRDLQSRYLTGCTLYSTAAPCMMCFGACIWSKIDRIVYGANQADIRRYGFRRGNARYKWRALTIEPDELYQYAREAHRGMIIQQTMRDECVALFHNEP